jgi:hypothetical protein
MPSVGDYCALVAATVTEKWAQPTDGSVKLLVRLLNGYMLQFIQNKSLKSPHGGRIFSK